jgi:hypothetical protein
MSTWMIFLLFFATLGWLGRRNRMVSDGISSTDEEARRELARVREMVEDLSSRFHVIETERDFYRELLDAPGSPALGRPGSPAPESAPEPDSASTRGPEVED